MKTKKIKIGLVFGGRSAERDVSINTAKQIKQYLNPKRYKVLSIEIGSDGRWPKNISVKNLKNEIDLAFIAMHGPFGEDGTMQGFFETLGIPYTFSGVLASSLGMDKYRTQQMTSVLGVTSPSSVLVSKNEYKDQPSQIIKRIQKLGKIVFVKPNQLGSSVGVQKTTTQPKALKKALSLAFRYDKEILVQELIIGREITAPVLGNTEAIALPLVEIVPRAMASDFYDYKAKYEEGGSDHLIPAPLPNPLSKQIQLKALKIHNLLGCRGVSRSDFIITPKNKIYFLEINTIPGMTATSLLPQSAAVAGIKFDKLLDKIITLSLK